jgi:viroplasmin and RNaseH domain-containing protein
MKKSHYVVWQGKQTGVFDSWTKVAPIVTGVQGARFKGFHSQESAEQAFCRPWQDFIDPNNKPKKEIPQQQLEVPETAPTVTMETPVEAHEFEFQDTEPPW